MAKKDNPLAILDTPEIIKVEKRYQRIRTALNIVAIILMVFLLYQINIAITQGKQARDTQLRAIEHNQSTLLCIVKESTNPIHTHIDIKTFKFTVDNSYIDKCVKENR